MIGVFDSGSLPRPQNQTHHPRPVLIRNKQIKLWLSRKLMIIQINQSNKIEKTNKDSIVGLADDVSFTALVKRKIKRRLQEDFRREGKPRLFVYRTFIASVVLLIKHARLRNISKIVIDLEYFGKDKMLRSIFLAMWSRFFKEVPEVSFGKVGKKSKVHHICYFTMKGKYRVNKVLDYSELKKLALG